MNTLTIEQVSTSDRKVIKTYYSKILLHDLYLEWLESVDVEKEMPMESDLEGDVELQVVPEFVHCVVNRDDFTGLEISWDQEELLFRLTIVARTFRFNVFNEDRQVLNVLFDDLKTWIYEKESYKG